MSDAYPFPASCHEVVLLPSQPGMDVAFKYTLGDILSDKVILNFGQTDICSCGEVIPLPATVKEMAARLAETLPLDTPVSYGVTHIYDETIVGVSEEEIVARLREWEEKYYNGARDIFIKPVSN